MADLGSPDAVADLQPVRGPEFELAARQRASRRKTPGARCSTAPALRTQRSIDGRHSKQGPGRKGDQVLQNPLRARPGIVEQRRGSAEPGKEQAVAHAMPKNILGIEYSRSPACNASNSVANARQETGACCAGCASPLGHPGGTRGVLQETGCRRVLAMEGTQSRSAGPTSTSSENRRAKGDRRPHAGSTAPKDRSATVASASRTTRLLAVGSDIGQGLLAGLGIDHGGEWRRPRCRPGTGKAKRRRVVQRQLPRDRRA